MPQKRDSEWEIVEEIPGERKPNSPKATLLNFLKSKKLWIGILIGAGLFVAVPFFRVMLQNAIRAWWIWVALALYFVWARLKKAGKIKR